MRKYNNFISALDTMIKNNAELDNILQTENSTQRDLMLAGFINHFQHTFELSWKLCKQMLQYESVSEAANGSPTVIIKCSIQYGYIDEWEPWKNMLDDRNEITHTYDPEFVIPMAEKIKNVHTNELQKLADNIENKLCLLYEMGLLPETEIDDAILDVVSRNDGGHRGR